LRSYRTVVQLIAATTTDAGLKVRAELDENKYSKGIKVSDAQLAAVVFGQGCRCHTAYLSQPHAVRARVSARDAGDGWQAQLLP
jgi:hypothetical protein